MLDKIDCGCFKSCTLERVKILNWHKRQLELQMEKFGLSHYAVAWIAWAKGLIFGIFIYHLLKWFCEKSDRPASYDVAS